MHKAFHKANFVDFPYTLVIFVGPNEGLLTPVDKLKRNVSIKERLTCSIGKFGKLRVIEIRGIAAVID